MFSCILKFRLPHLYIKHIQPLKHFFAKLPAYNIINKKIIVSSIKHILTRLFSVVKLILKNLLKIPFEKNILSKVSFIHVIKIQFFNRVAF